jgi:hypothetical protein
LQRLCVIVWVGWCQMSGLPALQGEPVLGAGTVQLCQAGPTRICVGV